MEQSLLQGKNTRCLVSFKIHPLHHDPFLINSLLRGRVFIVDLLGSCRDFPLFFLLSLLLPRRFVDCPCCSHPTPVPSGWAFAALLPSRPLSPFPVGAPGADASPLSGSPSRLPPAGSRLLLPASPRRPDPRSSVPARGRGASCQRATVRLPAPSAALVCGGATGQRAAVGAERPGGPARAAESRREGRERAVASSASERRPGHRTCPRAVPRDHRDPEPRNRQRGTKEKGKDCERAGRVSWRRSEAEQMEEQCRLPPKPLA